MAQSDGIYLKKRFGQHFLRDYDVLAKIIHAADLKENDSVIEIGCGDGFLTHALIDQPIKSLCCFEIDTEWSDKIKQQIADTRFQMRQQDFLTVEPSFFKEHEPWTIVANLPYNITFPILDIFRLHVDHIDRGIIMVQEEVAQRLVKRVGQGKDYGFASVFYQYCFEFRLLDKVLPQSFFPMPAVVSRLVAFVPKQERAPIIQETLFWDFLKTCFKQPRRTLRNNIKHMHNLKQQAVHDYLGTFSDRNVYIDYQSIPSLFLDKRAQQLDFKDFLCIWNAIIKS